MAPRTTKKVQDENAIVAETTEVEVKQEVELTKEQSLQNEVDALKAMMQQLMSQMQSQKDSEPVRVVEYTEEDIPPNRFIKVMSLLDHELNLSTEGYGRGKIYTFKRYGQIKDIIYSDLADIINSESSFQEKGAFYVLNELVVKRHGLEEIYRNILDSKTINSIYDMPTQEIVEVFQNAPEAQKETIVSLLLKRAVNGEELDYNKLMVMSKYYTRDIVEMVKEITSTPENN